MLFLRNQPYSEIIQLDFLSTHSFVCPFECPASVSFDINFFGLERTWSFFQNCLPLSSLVEWARESSSEIFVLFCYRVLASSELKLFFYFLDNWNFDTEDCSKNQKWGKRFVNIHKLRHKNTSSFNFAGDSNFLVVVCPSAFSCFALLILCLESCVRQFFRLGIFSLWGNFFEKVELWSTNLRFSQKKTKPS